MAKYILLHKQSISAAQRSAIKGHAPAVLWFTGLSGSGKSTVANAVDLVLIGDCFIGFEWQTKLFDQTGNLIWTPRRSNQDIQNSKGLDRWLSSVHERIEGVFHELQNTGRNIERLIAKTVLGLCTRIAMKLISHLLRLILRSDYGIDVQSFTIATSGSL